MSWKTLFSMTEEMSAESADINSQQWYFLSNPHSFVVSESFTVVIKIPQLDSIQKNFFFLIWI